MRVTHIHDKLKLKCQYGTII
uniref:Uncharacterized protein n=1 Tax=Lepeophtheirus salmonis TaxID=72036 RepID=A0A0K2V5K7_LEPSM